MRQSGLFLLLSISSALFGACAGGSQRDSDAGETGETGTDTEATGDETTSDATEGTGETTETDGGPAGVLDQPTKGGPIAVNQAGTTLAVANKATGDVTLFELPGMAELARIAVGSEPSSVSWAPDHSTLYVVNRAAGNVVAVLDADTDAPRLGGSVDVGSEPIQGALVPSGQTLYVTSFVDGALWAIDTATMTVSETIALGGAPRGVCISNNGDELDSDETIFVTDFYARARPGGKEASDDVREGRVFRVSADDHGVSESSLAPLGSSGIGGFEDTGAYPNQLYSCAVNQGYVYVTSVGASPAAFNGTTDFHQNVQGMVSVIDLATGTEASERTVNLNALVAPLAAPKRFAAVPTDIAFAPNSDFGYVTSTAANAVFRVDWSASPPTGGSPSGAAFLPTEASPVGITTSGPVAYAYNVVARSVSVVDLAEQETKELGIPSAPQPVQDSEIRALRGQKFFNTGLKRWSTNGWVACLACHPDGLTDNVTWRFPAGPRQTVDLSGSFNAGASVQRVFNWTAIFDEVHDFELNTRGVAGGTGAIVSNTDLNDDGTANTAARIDFVGPGGPGDPLNGFNIGSARAVAASGALPDDWDDIETYIKTIRAPHGATQSDGDAEAGRQVFEDGRCQNCHGGSLWTLSERYYTPQLDQDARPLTLASQGITTIGVRPDQLKSTDPYQVFVLENDANGPPARHSCVVRKVGSFGNAGPGSLGATEIRQNGNAAQGADGFNVPSLLSASLGAPYLHGGAADSLEILLDPQGSFKDHLISGNQVFSPTDEELRNLIAFLRSIDDSTPQFPIPADQQFCPDGLTFP